MVDLLELVKDCYYSPSMKGSNSLKQVLPSVLADVLVLKGEIQSDGRLRSREIDGESQFRRSNMASGVARLGSVQDLTQFISGGGHAIFCSRGRPIGFGERIGGDDGAFDVAIFGNFGGQAGTLPG